MYNTQPILFQECLVMENSLQLLPVLLISLILGTLSYKIAPRVEENPVIWLIFAIAPIINLVFMWYVTYRIVAFILDRLNFLASQYSNKEAVGG